MLLIQVQGGYIPEILSFPSVQEVLETQSHPKISLKYVRIFKTLYVLISLSLISESHQCLKLVEIKSDSVLTKNALSKKGRREGRES